MGHATQDWQFKRDEYLALSRKFGPFTVDAACDEDGYNSMCSRFYSTANSFLDTDAFHFKSNDTLWINPPFDDPGPFLRHYLDLKAHSPGLSCMFILPLWRGQPWRTDLQHFQLIKTYPAGTDLFTRPVVPGQPLREAVGPTRWPTQVWYDPPSSTPLLSTLGPSSPPTTPTSPPLAPPCKPPPPPEPPLSHVVSLSDPAASEQLITFEATARGFRDNSFAASTLLDSGASRNFVSAQYVKTLDLPIKKGEKTRVRQANGQITATSDYVELTYTLGDLIFTDTFTVLAALSFDVILGKPWLTRYNPDINWTDNTVALRGTTLRAAKHDRPPVVTTLTAHKMRKVLRKQGVDAFIATLDDLDAMDAITPPLEDPLTSVTTDQTSEWTSKLHTLLRRHRQTFNAPETLPPERPGFDHTIDLEPDSKPPPQRTYRMSPAELQEVCKQLEQLLEAGWIRPSNSPYGAPILFAKKKDGSLRMCIDYRALNSITVKDKHPLPRIEELFDIMAGAACFSVMDLHSGYHQVRVRPEDIQKTAFRTRFGLHEFTVLPFGLTNAPATFMRLMNHVLRPFLDKFVVVFLDDICVFSPDPETHLQHLDQVLTALAANDLRVKLSKCSFGRKELEFLGHLVGAAGVRPDPKKLKAVQDWPTPTDTTAVRSFIGFANFYRKFVHNFTTLAAPLLELTKSTVPFAWSRAEQASFTAIKNALTSAPCLIIPQTGPDSTFVLWTDASTFAVGSVLLQKTPDGLQPVAYDTRKLNPAETNYPVHELELLGVVHALRTHRHYLEGCLQFEVITDHDTLRHFFTQRDLSRRQARWLDFLSPYQRYMTISYRRGADNMADALSRRPDLQDLLRHVPAMPADAALHLISTVGFDTELLDSITAAYAHDPAYAAAAAPKRSALLQKDDSGLWHYAGRLAIPNDDAIRLKLLYEFHDAASAGHPGYHRTLAALSRTCWWPRMSRTVRSYCAACSTCQRIKPTSQAPPGLLQPLPVPERPWAQISMDLITDLPLCAGYDSIAVFVDTFSKMAHFVPCCKTITAPELARLFTDNIFKLHGMPRVIISDRDPRFTSAFWQTLFKLLQTRLNISTAYHPQTDGQTERTNRTLEQLLRAYVHPQHDDWVNFLATAEFAYNSHANASTGVSPFATNFGFEPETPAAFNLVSPSGNADAAAYLQRVKDIHELVVSNLALAKARQADFANRSRRELTFAVGDLVKLDASKLLLHGQTCAKLRDRHLGPYMVSEIVSPVAYRLTLPSALSRVHPVFHVSRLLPWATNSELPAHEQPVRPTPTAADFVAGEDVFEVDYISDCRIPSGKKTVEFETHWTGYTDVSWQSYASLKKTDAMRVFLASIRWSQFTATDAFRRLPKKFRDSLTPDGYR